MSIRVGAGPMVLLLSVQVLGACTSDDSSDPLLREFRAQDECVGDPLPDTAAILGCKDKPNAPEGPQGCVEDDELENISIVMSEQEFLRNVYHNDDVWIALEHYKWSAVESAPEWTSEFSYAEADVQLPRVNRGNPVTFANLNVAARDFCGINPGEWIFPIALHVYPKGGGEPWLVPLFNTRATGVENGDCPLETVIDPIGWVSWSAQRKECPAELFPQQPPKAFSLALCPTGRDENDSWECGPGDTVEWIYFEDSSAQLVEFVKAYEANADTVEWGTAQIDTDWSYSYRAEARVSNATVEVGLDAINRPRAYGYIHVSELTWSGNRKPSEDVSLRQVSLYARHPDGGPTIVFPFDSPSGSAAVRWP